MTAMISTLNMGAAPLIVAHRGASGDAPENTLPAFRLAWEQGADAIEGDFYLTRDGQIVCIHDADTERVAGIRQVVAESTFDQLRKLDVGSWKGEAFKGVVIPSADEVFALVPSGKLIYVEIKCGAAIVPGLLAAVARSGLKPEQVVFISFQAEVIRELKRMAPQFTANWLCSLKQGDDGVVKPSPESILRTLKEISADGFSSSLKYLSEEYINAVRDAGYAWHVWTVDDPEVARRCIRQGARSVTTNLPGKMREALR